MRDIKYKAWIKEHESMELVLNLDLLNWAALVTTDFTGNYGSSDIFEFKDIELMQFTGLQDENDVDIYEEDILEIHDGIGTRAIVVWRKDTASFSCQWINDNSESSNHLFGVESCEVIGNIHESPELLEGMIHE